MLARVSTLGIHVPAKPSRLTKNRHGTFCLRWIVPVGLREDGSPREIRFSLRTTDPGKARILALEFNLALERLRAMTRDKHPHAGVTPLTVTIGETKWDIQNDNDRRLFDQLLRDNPDMRQALRKTINEGMMPAEAMAALVQQVKTVTAAAAPVANPTLMRKAIDIYVGSRGTISDNKRSTAGEKRRTMELLWAHLQSHGRQHDTTYVHEIRRDELVEFIEEYAKRPAKDTEDEATPAKNIAATGESRSEQKAKKRRPRTLSPRTVVKAISHLNDVFVYALGKNWVAVNPVDQAFRDATAGLCKGASSAKRKNGYELFSKKELEMIFEPARYLGNLPSADEFWAPLIALYTGARLGEIVTLLIDDIFLDEEERVYLMRVKDDDEEEEDGPTQSTKTDNSIRCVPLPKALVDLGLPKYVEHVKELGASVLFPHRELNKTRLEDPSKHVSRAFGEHLDALGITSRKKVYHSLRHTVVTALNVNHTPVGDAELIVGHAAQQDYLRLSKAGGQSAGQSSTHVNSYLHSADYDPGSLYARLKAHMERSLVFPLDIPRLAEAAEILRELTIKKGNAYFGPSWTLVSVRAGHARRLDFDTVLGRSGQLRFGHLDDAGPPSRRDVVKFKACLLVGRPARRGSNLI